MCGGSKLPPNRPTRSRVAIASAWIAGDQFSLLCEALPGERIRLNSYVQRQPLYTIAGGMPTATVEIGDRADENAGWVGPYIGETLGRARSVVHFDPLLAAARNRPTAIAIGSRRRY